MKVVAIVQARLGSTRLPGKVLMDICGTTLLERVIERTLAAKLVGQLVVATTADSSDDVLAEFLAARRIPFYRGPVDDVMARFHGAASKVGADIIVRVTADDPLKDPRIIDRVVRHLLDHPELAYVSNTLKPTFPEGLDIEAFRFQALDLAHGKAALRSEREHVTPYIYKHPEMFRVANLESEVDLSAWRWTVDEPRDMQFMRAVFGHFRSSPLVGWEVVAGWLREHPEVAGLNADIRRNAGYEKSLSNDQVVQE